MRLIACCTTLLLLPAAVWACSCKPVPPLCQTLAEKGLAALGDRPDSKVFYGKVLTSSPATEQEAWKLELAFAERHPEAKAQGGRGFLNFEGRKRFFLELWDGVLSPAGREAILAAREEPGKFSLFDGGSLALSRLEVIEGFQNAEPGEVVEMLGGLGGADCSFHFKPGATYVVTAGKGQGFWATSGCSRTHQVSGSSAELEALRAAKQGKPVARSVYGSLYDSTERGVRDSFQRLTNWPVTLKGRGGELATTTDASGQFMFRDLEAGRYELEARKPGWATKPITVEVVTGCKQALLGAREQQSSVSGRVRPLPGQPLARVPISLVPVKPPPDYWRAGQTSLDADGNFSIKGVEPGEYLLVVNPRGIPFPSSEDLYTRRPRPGLPYAGWFYPGVDSRERAEMIRVERGVEVKLPQDWVVQPPLVERTVSVIATWPDGMPAPAVRAVVKDQPSGANVASCGPANEKGELQCKMFVGRRYKIEAFTERPLGDVYYWSAADVPAETAAGPAALVIRLAQDGPKPRYFMIGGQPTEIRMARPPSGQ